MNTRVRVAPIVGLTATVRGYGATNRMGGIDWPGDVASHIRTLIWVGQVDFSMARVDRAIRRHGVVGDDHLLTGYQGVVRGGIEVE